MSKKESKSSSKMVLVVQLSRQYSKCNFDDDLDTLTGTWDSIILPGRLKYHCIAFRIHQIGFHIIIGLLPTIQPSNSKRQNSGQLVRHGNLSHRVVFAANAFIPVFSPGGVCFGTNSHDAKPGGR